MGWDSLGNQEVCSNLVLLSGAFMMYQTETQLRQKSLLAADQLDTLILQALDASEGKTATWTQPLSSDSF